MAAALRRFFTRRRRPVADPVTEPAATESRCPCTDPDKEQFYATFYEDSLRGECHYPGMLSGCYFHTLDRSRSRVS